MKFGAIIYNMIIKIEISNFKISMKIYIKNLKYRCDVSEDKE